MLEGTTEEKAAPANEIDWDTFFLGGPFPQEKREMIASQ